MPHVTDATAASSYADGETEYVSLEEHVQQCLIMTPWCPAGSPLRTSRGCGGGAAVAADWASPDGHGWRGGVDSPWQPQRGPVRGEDPRALLNHVRNLQHDLVGEGDAERLGRLEVHHELEGHRLFDGKISRLGAFENAVDVVGGAAE
jgi:hypothetical protein